MRRTVDDVLRAVCQRREPESRSRQDVDEDQPRLSGGPDYAHPVGLGQIRQGKEAELEKRYGDRAIVLAASRDKSQRPASRQRRSARLEAYLNLSPDDWAFEKLADIYLARGDEAMWQATLDANLNHEDLFQAHYLVQQKLAEHFMAKKDWLKALPYAEAAASSGPVGPSNAWSTAKRRSSTGTRPRKPPATPVASRAGYRWYAWCRTSGHGNIEEARPKLPGTTRGSRIAATRRRAFPSASSNGAKMTKPALAAYRKAMEGTKSPLAALLSAMMMDAEHRDAERDELLAAIQKLDPPEANRKLIVKLAALVQAALANEPNDGSTSKRLKGSCDRPTSIPGTK